MRRRQPVEGSETGERLSWYSRCTEERRHERARRKEALTDRGLRDLDGCRRCNNTGRVDFARRPGWDRDCPDCQGGPDGEAELPDPECTACRGHGRNPDPSTGWGDEPCPDCWRDR